MSNAVLIVTAKLRPASDEKFAAWKFRHDTVIAKAPGFIGSDIIPPKQPDGNNWTIILNFLTPEDLAAWQQSRERAALIAEGAPLLQDGRFAESVQPPAGKEDSGSNVTEVIFSKIKPGMED